MEARLFLSSKSRIALLIIFEPLFFLSKRFAILASLLSEAGISVALLASKNSLEEISEEVIEIKKYLLMRGYKYFGLFAFAHSGQLLLRSPLAEKSQFIILLSYPLATPDLKKVDYEVFLKLSVPTLLLGSKNDPLLPSQLVRTLAAENEFLYCHFFSSFSRYLKSPHLSEAEIASSLSEVILLWLKNQEPNFNPDSF